MLLFRALLYCYPAAFRHEYGDQMLLVFTEQLRETRSAAQRARLWWRAALDAFAVAPREHGHVIFEDLRYARRMMAANPTFTAVAVLSLGLGIGANTAIFSLWNGVVHASLPGVRHPEQLVMLTDPGQTGKWSGQWISRVDGDRAWLTFGEFEQLRDHASSFSGVMASESNLNYWPVRFEDAGPELARGRFVSGGFFDFLGVTLALGRAFTPADDRQGAAPYAVLSYNYWQRRFGGRAGVLGKILIVRKMPLTILGVAPPGFIGETSGQQPDLWIPIGMQPSLDPGGDWLHDKAPDKVMWLNVFGRLRPGVTRAQAEAVVNAQFQADLASFYGDLGSEESRREHLDQHIGIRPASRGASRTRHEYSDSLTALMAAVGVLMLIACANLANLLLARGASRKPEIALRLSLGASRGRLIRQLITESLALAALGGVTGFGAAFVLHGALVKVIAQSDNAFRMDFRLDPLVLGFTFAVTLAAALLFGALPAWQMTKADPGAGLKEESRSATGSAGRMRWGRFLVSAQLALSLPLLVGAGLLARTLYNVQHIDLGFPAGRLLLVRVNMHEAGYNAARRHAAIDEIVQAFQQIPGVRAASFSRLGVMTGGNSTEGIQVEGYVPRSVEDRLSDLDGVGAGYFSTLGVRILAGREILEADREGGPKVCVINEAFAKRFFDGRNPLGMHITAEIREGKPVTYEVVGVAGNAHTQNLREEVHPRFFIPGTEETGESEAPVFLIRTAIEPASILPAARQAIHHLDPSLPIITAQTAEDQISPWMSQEQSTAQIAVVFGSAALALAAIGLYGVLAYGVARRRNEIAIRIALGARPARVVGMILGETSTLVIAGLLAGYGLAYGASRLIASRLFGVAPEDPATLAAAITLLTAVAFFAAYLPAQRASRLEPMAALRQE